MYWPSCNRVLSFVLALPFVALTAWGAETPTGIAGGALADLKGRAAQVRADRVQLQVQMDELRRAIKSAGGDVPESLSQEAALLQRIDLLLSQETSALHQAEEMAQRQEQLQDELSHMRAAGVPETPPYSIVFLDEIQDEIDLAQTQVRSDEASVTAATEAVDQARQEQDVRERARRAAKEGLETNTDLARSAALDAALRAAQLEARASNETLRLREVELSNETALRDIDRQRLVVMQEKAAFVGKDACLVKDDLDKQVSAVDKDETELQRTLAAARRELDTAERRMMMAQQRVDQDGSSDPVRAAEVAARRTALETLQLEVRSLTQRLQRSAEIRQVWERRYQVSEDPPAQAQLNGWLREAEAAVEQLGREERVQRSRLTQLHQTAKTLQQQIDDTAQPAPEVARWLIDQQGRFQEQTTTYESLLTSIETARHLQEKLVKQIEQHSTRLSLRERLRDLRDVGRAAWNYELTSVEDRPITVGKIALGALLVSLGFWFASFFSTLLGRRLLPRLGLDARAASILQSVVFYVLLSGLFLIVLNVINVPLTVFTFVGGAVAIGVGFGSQNIVNNFISGLILMAERPIKLGDVVTVDGTKGTVEHIGPRSTRVLGEGNIDIIIPNSVFLERNVVNWTLSTDSIRTHVSVGVACGSDVQLVSSLLRLAVAENEKILKQPEPFVLFTDFAESALQLEIQFWIRVRSPLDEKLAQSEVRFAVDRLFRQEKIEVAFPQRDLHLRAATPIAVHLVEKEEGEK